MATFESCRNEAALALAKVGRRDLVAWVVPCLDKPRNPGRTWLSLRHRADDRGKFAEQCRWSQQFLRRACTGAEPRTMLVLVWHERLGVAENWGYLSTGVQSAHPDVVYLRDCRPFAPLTPWLRDDAAALDWDEHVLKLASPDLDADAANLALAVASKAEVVRQMQLRLPLTSEHTRTLDGRWLDMESSRVLVTRGVVSPYWESRLMAQRFMGPWRERLPALLRLPLPSVSMLHCEDVLSLVGSRKLIPVKGWITVQDNPFVLVEIAAERFRLNLCPGHGDDDPAVVRAAHHAVGVLAHGDRGQPAAVGRQHAAVGPAVYAAGGQGDGGAARRDPARLLGARRRGDAPAPPRRAA